MKQYQIQVDTATLTKGITTFEVKAESRSQAIRLYHQGKSIETDYHESFAESSHITPQVISESELPPSLLDYE